MAPVILWRPCFDRGLCDRLKYTGVRPLAHWTMTGVAKRSTPLSLVDNRTRTRRYERKPGSQSACRCHAGTGDLRGAVCLPARAHAENSACDHVGSPIPVPVCAGCAQRSGRSVTSSRQGSVVPDTLTRTSGEETGPEFPGSDWCLTLGAATIQAAASEVGRGAWTSAVYRGCQGRRRGHQPGTARRYSSYRAPNRPCSSGCSNP